MKIILKNLTKEFQNKKTGEATRAVDNLNIELPSDKLIGLLGPSGCGKSTTLYMIAGLHKATEGEIYFGEKLVSNLPPEKRGIGLVFQNYALYPHMTVEQNIMFPLISRHEDKKNAKIKALEYAKLVGIDHLLNRKPSQLSGGQQQRVAIARALVKQPDVLLLDEPLSNLDARLRLQTREEIRRIQKQTGTTTLFVTHDQEEAMSISDLIVVMNYGVIHQMGRPQDVYNDPVDLFVATFLGTPPINVIPATKDKNKITFGNGQVLKNAKVDTESTDLKVGIRPEFIELDPNGEYTMVVDYVEYVGRDKIVNFTFEGCDKVYKAIIQSSGSIELNEGNKVRFNLSKYFIFDENGKRLF